MRGGIIWFDLCSHCSIFTASTLLKQVVISISSFLYIINDFEMIEGVEIGSWSKEKYSSEAAELLLESLNRINQYGETQITLTNSEVWEFIRVSCGQTLCENYLLPVSSFHDTTKQDGYLSSKRVLWFLKVDFGQRKAYHWYNHYCMDYGGTKWLKSRETGIRGEEYTLRYILGSILMDQRRKWH